MAARASTRIGTEDRDSLAVAVETNILNLWVTAPKVTRLICLVHLNGAPRPPVRNRAAGFLPSGRQIRNPDILGGSRQKSAGNRLVGENAKVIMIGDNWTRITLPALIIIAGDAQAVEPANGTAIIGVDD